jgi:hypothetical protein
MANTIVTTVEKLSDWNNTLAAVNTLLKNPGPGCSAIAALSAPLTAPHLWAKTADIAAVQNALKQVCSNNTFTTPIPDLWKQSIIDEINTALGNGWCNCGACSACSYVSQKETDFLTAISVAGCHQTDMSNPCDTASYAQNLAAMSAAGTYGAQAGTAYQTYAAKLLTVCTLGKQLALLNTQLTAQNAAYTAAINYAVGHGYTENPWIAPAVIAIAAQVNATKAQIAAINTQITTAQAAADAAKTQGDSAAAQSMSLATAYGAGCPDFINVLTFFTGFNKPWPAPKPNAPCCNAFGCSASWKIQYQMTTVGGVNQGTTPWYDIVYGRFGPGGAPYYTTMARFPTVSTKTCASSNCTVGITQALCQPTSTVSLQVVIYTYPAN